MEARGGRGGGCFFFKKNAIFIAFSGVSRQFRPFNFNLTLRRCRCRLDECFNGMVMFDMALKMDTNGGLLQTIDGHKFHHVTRKKDTSDIIYQLLDGQFKASRRFRGWRSG